MAGRLTEIRIIVGESLPGEQPRNAVAGIERQSWDMLGLIFLTLIVALLVVGRRQNR